MQLGDSQAKVKGQQTTVRGSPPHIQDSLAGQQASSEKVPLRWRKNIKTRRYFWSREVELHPMLIASISHSLKCRIARRFLARFCSPFHLGEVSQQIAAFVTDFVLKSIIGGAGQPWCLEMARCRIRGGTSSWAMCAQTFAHLCTLRAPLRTHTHTLAPPPNSYLAADQRTL